ncbi:MAG TPA: GNAT family N-acetyltransferase [Burkholderiales bacterium]|nr:GNAT family N-acetyltransferase [Burkholderiales bacterium]
MQGSPAALQRFVMRRAAQLAGLHVYRVMVRALDQGAAPGGDAGPLEVPGIELRLRSPAQLLAHSADAGLELEPSALVEGERRGEGIIAAMQGERLAGYLWFAFRPAPHSRGTWAEFQRDTVYLYRAFVRPQLRGRGIATALYRRADARFLPRPCRRALACVELHNHASTAALRKAGFESQGRIVTLQPTRRLFLWRSPAAARAGFRFSTQA